MNTLYFTSLTLCIVLTIYLVTCTNIKARVIELSLIVLSIIPIINTIVCTAICSLRKWNTSYCFWIKYNSCD